MLPHCSSNTHFKRTLLASFIIMCTLVFGTLSAPVEAFASEITPHDIVKQVNTVRAQYALPPLNENHLLTVAANNKANDMRADKYFAHVDNEGKTFHAWIEEAGYSFTFAGENLAKNFNNLENLMDAWLESPSHQANILDRDFCEIGVASSYNSDGGTLVVQMFGCRHAAQAAKTSLSSKSQNVTAEWSNYSFKPLEPDTFIVSNDLRDTSARDAEGSGSKGNERLYAGLVALAAVAVVSISQRRQHYYHVYSIPISVKKPNQN